MINLESDTDRYLHLVEKYLLYNHVEQCEEFNEEDIDLDDY